MMDWKRDSTAESLVMLRPRTWLLFMRLTKVVTAFCRAFRNCAWLSSDSPFWYCCQGIGNLPEHLPHPQSKLGQGPSVRLSQMLSSELAAGLTGSSRGVCERHPQHLVHERGNGSLGRLVFAHWHSVAKTKLSWPWPLTPLGTKVQSPRIFQPVQGRQQGVEQGPQPTQRHSMESCKQQRPTSGSSP